MNLWIRFGCFLTGYRYQLLRQCSEAAVKVVKRYTSAMVIICLLWGVIGYVFSNRYLGFNEVYSSIFGLFMIVIIVQIERQIILADDENRSGFIFRLLLGLVMAIIGSVILDQKIFMEDIEKIKISQIQEDVKNVLPYKTEQIDKEIDELTRLIDTREVERTNLLSELSKNPNIQTTTISRKYHRVSANGPDGIPRDTLVPRSEQTIIDIPNPKAELLPGLEKQMADLQAQKTERQNARISMRADLEKELKDRTGFLDELKLLMDFLWTNTIGMFVWGVFFTFFLIIEMLIVWNKWNKKQTDYDTLVQHHMSLRIDTLKEVSKKVSPVRSFANIS